MVPHEPLYKACVPHMKECTIGTSIRQLDAHGVWDHFDNSRLSIILNVNRHSKREFYLCGAETPLTFGSGKRSL